MHRQEKIEARIRRILSGIIQHHLKDPRVAGNVTVSRVEVTNDISLAKVHFSILADEGTRKEILQTLEKAKGFLRTELAKDLKIRHTPTLEFKLDTSVERGMHIQHLLDEIKAEEQLAPWQSASLSEITEAIHSRDGFALIGHVIPDGDCIGSLVAMHAALTALGKKVTALLADPLPPNYYFLPGAENIRFTFDTPVPDMSEYSTVIYLDCAEQNRVGEAVLNCVAHAEFRINIDHHGTNDYFSDLNYVEDKAANGEVLYEIIQALGVEITPEIALALFTAIVMDTGNFSFSNVTANTFQVAGALIELGADHNRVRDAMYESKDPRDLHLLGVALSHLQYTEDRRLTWMRISLEEAERFQAGDLHPEGIVNFGRTIKGTEVALIFREVESGVIKVGFRSKGQADVAKLAQGLGGGGHTHAAGVRLCGTMETIEQTVIDYVKKAMEI